MKRGSVGCFLPRPSRRFEPQFAFGLGYCHCSPPPPPYTLERGCTFPQGYGDGCSVRQLWHVCLPPHRVCAQKEERHKPPPSPTHKPCPVLSLSPSVCRFIKFGVDSLCGCVHGGQGHSSLKVKNP